MKTIILLVCMMTFGYAVPAYQGAISFTQNDGSTFEGTLSGDEWFNWVKDTHNQTIVYNSESQNYEYAQVVQVAGVLELVPSGVQVSGGIANIPTGSSSASMTDETLSSIWKRKRTEALSH